MSVKLFFRAFLLVSFLFAGTIFAQSPWRVPQMFNYQIVVRDANDWLVRSQSVGLRLSIQHGTTPATTLYAETHAVTTDINGYLSVNVGTGTPAYGRFDTISWGIYDSVLLYAQIDVAGGTNYTLSSLQQLAAVPYALIADETQNFSDVLDNGNHAGMKQLKDLKDPTDPQDVLTKFFLDSVIADFLIRTGAAMHDDTLCISTSMVPYSWHSQSITASGNYKETLAGKGPNGKDSIYVLHITVSDGTHNVYTHTDYPSYTWPRNGQTYTVSGNHTFSYIDASGCQSVDTLKLTITAPPCVANSYAVQAKDSYLWETSGTNGHGDGIVHTTTGIYYGTVYNSNCVDTLDLTILEAVHTAIDSFVCEGVVVYDTLLYEGFESGIPSSWAKTTGSGNGGWTATGAVIIDGTNYYPFAGSKFAHEDGHESGNSSFLKTPQIAVSDPQNTFVQFKWMNSYWKNTSYSNRLSLRYSTALAGAYTQLWTSGLTTVQSTWYSADVALSTLAAGSYFFAFVDEDGGGDCGAIDEVYVLHRLTPAIVSSATAGSMVVTHDTLLAHNGADSIIDITWHIKANAVNSADTLVLQTAFPLTWKGVSFAKAAVKNQKYTSANGCDSTVTIKVNVLVETGVMLSACQGATLIQYYDTLLFEDFSSGSWASGWERTRGGYTSNPSAYPTNFWGIGSSLTFYGSTLTSQDGSKAAFVWSQRYQSGYSYVSGATSRLFTSAINIDDPANTTLSFTSRIWNASGNADELDVGYLSSTSTDHTSAVRLFYDDGSTSGWQNCNVSLSAVPQGVWRLSFVDYDYLTAIAIDNICVRTFRSYHIPATMPQGLSVCYDTIHTTFGYDSVRSFSVTIGAGGTVDVKDTICSAQLPYIWNTKEFTAAGVQSAVLHDIAGCDSTVNMTLAVLPSPTFSISGDTIQYMCKNTAITDVVFSADYAQELFATSGTLPTGVTYNSLTKTISGTPTASGSYKFYLTANSNQAPACASQSQSVSINVGDKREVYRDYTVCQSDTFVASTQIARLFFEDFEDDDCLDGWDIYTDLENYDDPIDGWERTTYSAYQGHSLVVNNAANSTVNYCYWGSSFAITPTVFVADPVNTSISFKIKKTTNFHNHSPYYGYYADKVVVYALNVDDDDESMVSFYVSDEDEKATQYTLQSANMPSILLPGNYRFVFLDFDMWGVTALDSIEVKGPQKILIPSSLPVGDTPTQDNFVAFDGCDSIIYTTWHVLPSYTSIENKAVCAEGLPYSFLGLNFEAAGSKNARLTAVNGCDSIVTVNLSVNPAPVIRLEDNDKDQTISLGNSIGHIVVVVSNGTANVSGLPDGVTYDSSTHKISGTPTAAGVYNYTITAVSNQTPACNTEVVNGTITVTE